MKIEILHVYENLDAYVTEMEKENADCNILWDKYAISPYWEKICQYAPFDMSDRKPQPIKNISKLKQQLKEMKKINFKKISDKFNDIVNALPNYDEDPIVVAIYPIDDDNIVVKEKQNGVLGVCIFGNMILNINPLADNYLDWISYVFAHEYHHCVWGNYWYVIKGESTRSLIETMLIDGQADAFAKSFNLSLNPIWLTHISEEEEEKLWEKHYKNNLYSTDFNYESYMFGDDNVQIPWCAGYFFGNKIIESFKKINPHYNAKQMIEISAEKIYEMSDYKKDK